MFGHRAEAMNDKNDRRNSEGTLRQKFNLIDIWFDFWHLTYDILHLTLDIQPMDQWTKGPRDQGTKGPMDQ